MTFFGRRNEEEQDSSWPCEPEEGAAVEGEEIEEDFEDEQDRNDEDDDQDDDSDDAEAFPYASPRILVVDARARAHGTFYGKWINAAVPPENLENAISEVLSGSPYGGAKWMVEKDEGFGAIELGPYPSLNDLSTLATSIAIHGPIVIELVLRFGGFSGIEHAVDVMENDFEGSYPTRGAWAREHGEMDERHTSESLARHVDWDAITREYEKQKEIFVVELDKQFFVFRE